MEAIDKRRLGVVKTQVTKAEKLAAGLVITSDEQYQLAGKKYIEVKKLEKEFAKEKKSWLDPINVLRNKVFEVSRPMEARFKAAKETIGDALTAWEEKVEADRQAAAKELEAKADSGEMSLPEATAAAGQLEQASKVSTDKGTLGQQVRHELVVDDPSKLDRKYLIPDMSLIKADYNATGVVPKGCKIEKRVVRTARTI